MRMSLLLWKAGVTGCGSISDMLGLLGQRKAGLGELSSAMAADVRVPKRPAGGRAPGTPDTAAGETHR